MELVIIFGPPAVGKMTVGHELCKATGFKLFHNHALIEPVLDIFPFGSPPYVPAGGGRVRSHNGLLDHLRIDNNHLTAPAAAAQIVTVLRLG